MFKKSLIAAFAVVCVTACTNSQGLKYEPFDDSISTFKFLPKQGIASGQKAFYIVYGQVGVDKAGTAVHFSGRTFFRIKDLLDKYPEMQTPPALKAEKAQEKVLNTMFPKGTSDGK